MRDQKATEHFHLIFMGMKFDVNKAKKIINYPHFRIDANIPISSLIQALEGTSVNKRYAMKKSNLKLPLLIGTIGEIHFVFDGHHRIWRAINEKRRTLPAYILTPEETRDICTPKALFDKLNQSFPTPVGLKGKIKLKTW